MDEKRKQMVGRRRSRMPKYLRGLYDKAVKGESMKAAITAFCHECVGYQHSAIADCASLACPLWAFRPIQEEPTPKKARRKRPRKRKKAQARRPPAKARQRSRGASAPARRGTSSSSSLEVRQCPLFPDLG